MLSPSTRSAPPPRRRRPGLQRMSAAITGIAPVGLGLDIGRMRQRPAAKALVYRRQGGG